MTTRTATYPLRLPVSIKSEAERLTASRTFSDFAERRGRADREAFDRLMARKGGAPLRAADEMPEV